MRRVENRCSSSNSFDQGMSDIGYPSSSNGTVSMKLELTKYLLWVLIPLVPAAVMLSSAMISV
jgi:hypothetical protein